MSAAFSPSTVEAECGETSTASMSHSGDASGSVVLCDVHGVEPDAVTVDALCRLQLGARRHRCEVRLRYASRELRELVEFMGLTEVLPD